MSNISTKRRLLTNFLSLASVQGLSFALPLITLPYLLKVLGPGKFGLISFAQAFIQYFILFTDYGFNLSATREISQTRDDNKKVISIFSTVMLIKILLLLFSVIILICLIFFIPKFKADSAIYIVTFGVVVGNVLFPIWFFQGIEQMKVISILNLISKTTFAIGIFVFVKNPNQYILVPFIDTLGSIVVGLIALLLIYYRYNIRFVMPSKSYIIFYLKEGWYIFVSFIMTSLYTTSNTFILGFFASDSIVGYYSSAEKIVKASLSVISPLIQTFYPYLSKSLQVSKEKTISILNRVFILVTIIMGGISIFIAFGTEPIVISIAPQYNNSISLIQILSPLPLIIGWANVFGVLTMINFNLKRELSYIYFRTSLLSVVLMVCLIPSLKEYGTSINAIMTETFATMSMVVILWKKGICIWKRNGGFYRHDKKIKKTSSVMEEEDIAL